MIWTHPLLFSICAFLMLLMADPWVGYRVFYKPGRFLRQLGTPGDHRASAAAACDGRPSPQASTIVTVLHQIGSQGAVFGSRGRHPAQPT